MVPACSPATASTAARPVSRSRRTWRAGSRSAAPAAVSWTRRPVRVNSATPSSASSSFTARESAGCETRPMGGGGESPVVHHGEEMAQAAGIHK